MKYVGGAGAFGPLWIVGEGPGKTEEMRGEPFVGKTGGDLRRMVERAGAGWQTVWRDNAIPYRVSIPKDGPARARLIAEHHGHLDARLREAAGLGKLPVVILAVGAVATQRLLEIPSIMDAWGGVYRWAYDDTSILVVPTIHPAAVMRTKLQTDKLLVDRAVTRAVRLALGREAVVAVTPEVVLDPTPSDVNQMLARAADIVVDTEFNPKKQETWIIGIEADSDDRVWSINAMTMTGLMRAVLKKHFARQDLVKTAHYHYADVSALAWAGVDTAYPWFDTMVAFNTLYPDLPAGLTHVARFYITGITNWKDMDKATPEYNAIDVRVTRIIRDAIRVEMTAANMWPVWEEEVQWALPMLYGLQERGLQVDRRALRRARVGLARERTELLAGVADGVKGLFKARVDAQQLAIDKIEQDIAKVASEHTTKTTCETHKDYKGLRSKKYTTKNTQCCCKVVASEASGVRAVLAGLQKQRTTARAKAAKWADRGFDPANNDHVRWLLYDKQALGLPVQRHSETKRPTANATAIAQLLVLTGVQSKQGVRVLLEQIKRVQHLNKLESTFYNVPVDKFGIVHPPYGIRTGTGRPAGGADEFLGEKGVSAYKFNVLNIPKEVRQIYVPYTR